MMRIFNSPTSGYTLTELLVVISIIGLLASVTLSALNDIRAQSRDAKRMADLREIKTAVERYYLENFIYPPEAWCDSSIGSASVSCPNMIAAGNVEEGWDTNSTFYTALVGGGYINDLPLDPLNNEQHYYYYEPINSDYGPAPGNQHQGYWIRVRLENGGMFYACGGLYQEHSSLCDQ